MKKLFDSRSMPAVWLAAALLLLVGACDSPAADQTPSPAAFATRPPDAAQLLPNGKASFEDILTGGQPTFEQLETARDLGYKSVINLRMPEEQGSTRPEDVESLGMTYVSLPIAGADGITEENAARLAEALASVEHPVIVHCASGNRVGALFAMKAFYVDGRTAEEALAIGRAAGVTRLEPVVEERLGLAQTGE